MAGGLKIFLSGGEVVDVVGKLTPVSVAPDMKKGENKRIWGLQQYMMC